MNKLNINKVGLTLGSFVGLLHACWSVLVAIGWAQSLVDFNLKMHMAELPLTILSFDFGTAVMLIVIAFLVGYVVGSAFAFLWNRFH